LTVKPMWGRHWSRPLWFCESWLPVQSTQGSIPYRGAETLHFITTCSRTVVGRKQLPNQLGSA
jgi:hypothetical protein